MSIINETSAPCSKCGQIHKVTVYRSINVSENPELKDKVKDGSLFLWECPHCGQVNLARYETLYHDPAGKIMIWLLPEGNLPESQMKSITMHTKAMGGYTLRRVNDTGSLMEKVLIHDAGLDDAVIEMCKYVTRLEIAAKMPDQDKDIMSSVFHFYRMEGEGDSRLITLSYPYKGQMMGVNIGWNVYQDCCGILERNPQARPGDGFIRVDSSWTDSIIR